MTIRYWQKDATAPTDAILHATGDFDFDPKYSLFGSSSGFIVAWQVEENGVDRVYTQRFDQLGEARGGPEVVQLATGTDQQRSPVLISDELFYTAQLTGTSTNEIYSGRVSTDGRVSFSSPTGDFGTVDAGGQIFGSDYYIAGGASLVRDIGQTSVNFNATGAARDADFASNSQSIFVVWQEISGGIEARASNTSRTAFRTAADVVVSSGGSDPTVVALENDGAVVLWQEDAGFPGKGLDIYGRFLDPNGEVFGDKFLVNARVSGIQRDVDVAAGLGGQFAVIFNYQAVGYVVKIFDQTGRVVAADTIISDGAPEISTPQIAHLGDGRYVVTWADDAGSGGVASLYSRIIDPRDGKIVDFSDFGSTLYGNYTDDEISGRNGNDTLFGFDGNDYLFGGTGNDTLIGGRGTDALFGGEGTDTADYSDATSAVAVRLDGNAPGFGDAAGDYFSSIERVIGSDFVDFLVGDGNDNVLEGGLGDDVVFGEGGNDTLIGGPGADLFNGGQGNDTVTYDDNRLTGDGVAARLDTGQGTFGNAAGDTYQDIENLTGTRLTDFLVGNDGNNILEGKRGEDVLFGLGGNDILRPGLDEAFFEDPNKADIVNGGSGIDMVSYIDVVGGRSVEVYLDGSAANAGAAEFDMISEVENVEGTNADDVLVGDSFSNVLIGAAGADILRGGAGSDTLFGGSGADTLTGGADADVFYFNTATSFVDVISDFDTSQAGEVLYFDGLLTGVFNFLGVDDPFTGGGNTEARYNTNQSELELDFDGGGVVDLRLQLVGVIPGQLDAGDFVFA
ncbi:MAG: calcium-binding protein [Pseudomonadota bacterium]